MIEFEIYFFIKVVGMNDTFQMQFVLLKLEL